MNVPTPTPLVGYHFWIDNILLLVFLCPVIVNVFPLHCKIFLLVLTLQLHISEKSQKNLWDNLTGSLRERERAHKPNVHSSIALQLAPACMATEHGIYFRGCFWQQPPPPPVLGWCTLTLVLPVENPTPWMKNPWHWKNTPAG